MVAVNQTRSWKEEIFRDKKHHLQMTSYEIYVFARAFYWVMNIWMIKQ